MMKASRRGFTLVEVLVVVAVVAFLTVILVVPALRRAVVRYLQFAPPAGARKAASSVEPDAVAVAGQPVVWTTDTPTFRDVQERAREFRTRQWLEGYEKRSRHNPACDAEVMEFIRVWIARSYEGSEATHTLSLEDESDRLANDPNCTDPLALTAAADNSLDSNDCIRRFERALAAYPGSGHWAYPQLNATIRLMTQLDKSRGSDQLGELGASALKLLTKCFSDGSFASGDQREIADILVYGWGKEFFAHDADAVCEIVHGAGPSYQWLALVLDGERYITAAWQARGAGYASTVTDGGWQGFEENLAKAREVLAEAWKLQPGYPMAPCLMITVSLGDSGIQEMRLWFDRTLAAQIDDPYAWSAMRWGLRPRWHGSQEALLALGRTAVNTGRFDTDVPREFINCIGDVESEMDLPAGRHIFGRADIWPDLQKMFQGYLAAPLQSPQRNSWLTTYAVAAYFAGKYDLAREQLEALNWNPVAKDLLNRGTDLSRMPLEVAARTGPAGAEVSTAETAYNAGDVASALKQYTDLASLPAADARTKEFIQYRLAQLAVENRLHQGEWVELMPANDQDPTWVISLGKVRRLADGALEVEYGPKGHMLFLKARVRENFEVRGQFEMIRSSDEKFQAGLVMGQPDFDGYNWYGFGFKRAVMPRGLVYFGRGWSRPQTVRPVVLTDVANSFDFIFRNGQVTASVNGVEALHQATSPVQIQVPNNAYLVGLGAFGDSNGTVIRYRDVQLRELQ